MITERETAAIVSEALPDDFAAYNKALSRILHHLDADILRPIHSGHPDLSPTP